MQAFRTYSSFHILRCQHSNNQISHPACNDLPLLIHHNAAHAAVLAPRVAWHHLPASKAFQKKDVEVKPEIPHKWWFIAGKNICLH
jgi:hypothetical protein